MFSLRLIDNTPEYGAVWQCSDEGPFSTAKAAVDFAHAECGSIWAVLNDTTGVVVAIGDNRGIYAGSKG